MTPPHVMTQWGVQDRLRPAARYRPIGLETALAALDACSHAPPIAPSSSGEQERARHPAGGTDADQPSARVSPCHLVGESREDPPARRRPRVAYRYRAAVHVHP